MIPRSDAKAVAGRLVAALERVMPVRINDGPDYAEAYFGDGKAHSTQAMTMNPQDWIEVQSAFEAVRAVLAAEGEK